MLGVQLIKNNQHLLKLFKNPLRMNQCSFLQNAGKLFNFKANTFLHVYVAVKISKPVSCVDFNQHTSLKSTNLYIIAFPYFFSLLRQHIFNKRLPNIAYIWVLINIFVISLNIKKC